MDLLTELGAMTGTDKATHHGYTKHYHNHFKHLRDEVVNLVEIGVASGSSLKMWGAYFTHPQTEILGIDINPECHYESGDGRTKTEIFDATKYVVESNWDIIIDDGSHTSEDILSALRLWWPLVVSGGWYVIEDLAVQWRSDYGGRTRYGSPATLNIKDLVDDLMCGNKAFGVDEVHVYKEIVFLRKA
jgi:hypothetical protein